MKFSSTVSLILALLVQEGQSVITVASNSTAAVPVAPYFASLAVEWQGVRRMFLKDLKLNDDASVTESMLNPRALQLVKNLGSAARNGASTTVIIRIGGNSATRAYWKPSGAPWTADAEVLVEISPLELKVMNAVAIAARAKLLINIGMRDPNPFGSYTSLILQSIKDTVDPSVLEGIEIGNEPDHYNDNGNTYRSPSYSYADFLPEFRNFGAISQNILPNVAIAGPGMDPGNFNRSTATFARDAAPLPIGLVTLHQYELPACDPLVLYSMTDLLNYVPSRYDRLSETIASTKQNNPNTLVVFSELGSASCSGVDGVSNAFGSGLWVIRAAFETAFRGIDYACFSGSPQAAYAPITVTPIRNKQQDFLVNPAYYGMLMFNLAIAGSDTKIYPLPTSTGSDLLQYWIAENAESTTLVVLNLRNSELKESVTIPNGFTFARIIKMTSSGGALSLDNFNIGGVDFNLKASEGSANYGEELLTLAGNGEIDFTVPAESAFLIRMSAQDLGAVLPPDIVEGDGAFSGSMARPAASFVVAALLVLALF